MEKNSPIHETREMDSPSLSTLHESCSRFESKGEMDEQNPQNWSNTRKTLLFIALMSSSLLADGYGMGWHADYTPSNGMGDFNQ
ncbi:Major facilitator superfamily domain general substrate transporter [Penicillium hetheringtonii]|uniref:Major facilitator superfamily domain general substrate transporter n=1 Tax=Penicillium hetheringtonii TaxID=911720 RepID=A0AAD6DB08_9EURO|nr:Major facilitator superfamily domain general substrate transporter [Penicillium hetheringtonii]